MFCSSNVQMYEFNVLDFYEPLNLNKFEYSIFKFG